MGEIWDMSDWFAGAGAGAGAGTDRCGLVCWGGIPRQFRGGGYTLLHFFYATLTAS